MSTAANEHNIYEQKGNQQTSTTGMSAAVNKHDKKRCHRKTSTTTAQQKITTSMSIAANQHKCCGK